MIRLRNLVVLLVPIATMAPEVRAQGTPLSEQAAEALRRAVDAFRSEIGTEGRYLW